MNEETEYAIVGECGFEGFWEPAYMLHGYEQSLIDLVTEPDFISLHCAFTPEQTDLIGKKKLRAMKPTSYLISTARGELVDEEALLRALQEGWIAGAAMDAFKEEPATASPLLRLDNFIATPHIGAATYESILRMGTLAVENALQVLRGERPPHVVNPEIYEKSK